MGTGRYGGREGSPLLFDEGRNAMERLPVKRWRDAMEQCDGTIRWSNDAMDGAMARWDGAMARCDGAMARWDGAMARCDGTLLRNDGAMRRKIIHYCACVLSHHIIILSHRSIESHHRFVKIQYTTAMAVTAPVLIYRY